MPLSLEEKKEASSLLQGEGLVFVYPTASYYALGCKATDEKAVEKIYSIKGREPDKPLLVLVAGLDMFYDYAQETSHEAGDLLKASWPGPLTLVTQIKEGASTENKKIGKAKEDISDDTLAKNLNLKGPEIGFRQDSDANANSLIAMAGVPLVGTSANRAGANPKTTAQEVFAELGEAVDFYFDGGKTKGGDPSTVVRFSENKLCVLRAGALSMNLGNEIKIE